MRFSPGFYWVVAKNDSTDIVLVQVLPVSSFQDEQGETIETRQEVQFFGVLDGCNWDIDTLLNRCTILCRIDTPTIDNGCYVIARNIVGGVTISTIGRPDHYETIVFGNGRGWDKRYDYPTMVDALINHGRLLEKYSPLRS